MKTRIVNKSRHKHPEYIAEHSAQMHLKANIDNDIVLRPLERTCQIIIAKHERAEWIEVEELKETERGSGGFGNTGKH
ncbi:MAG: hypothetical protein Q8868_07845 [Bacteroidota bacterium]|nr:hypothetical protein [Bacteroidota bacterium]